MSLPINKLPVKPALFCLSLAVLLSLGSCGKDQGQHPTRTDIVEAVYASGTLQPREVYTAQTPISGVVKAVLVEDGDAVNVGTPIMRIETDELEAQLQEAHERLAQTRARLNPNSAILSELREQVASARAQYEQDSAELARYKRLFEQKAVAKQQFEMVELRATTSKNTMERAKAALQARKDQLQTELTSARGAVNLLEARQTNYLLESKLKGRVYEIFPEVGELVGPQQPLARIGKADAYYLELQIDEADINKVAENQEVLIRLENYGEQQFDAKITRIYPLLDQQTQTFRVDAVLKNPPKKLYPGLSVEANIITAKRDQALVIPRAFVHPGDSVWVESADGSVQKRKVQTGVSNLEQIEIIEGLSAQDIIYETQP